MQSHHVYLIENLINGHIYVGKHSTENLDDGYMGSGKLVTKAIAKHGLENFRKHIIKEFDTSEEAFEFEKSIVTEEFVADRNTYNLKIGGVGGGDWSHINSDVEFRREKNQRAMRITNHKIQTDPAFAAYRAMKNARTSVRTKRLHEEGKIPYEGLDWTGRKHTQKSKEAIGRANAIAQSGQRNSNFGKAWVHNDELKKSKSVSKDQLQLFLDEGWVIGRKMKW